MSKVRKPVLIVVLALAAALIAETAVLAQTIGRNGRAVTAVRTVVNDDIWNTSSQSYIDIADMKTFVTVPAGEKAILLITFSAATTCGSNASAGSIACLMRVTLDGQVVSPGPLQWGYAWGGQAPDNGPRSMQWVAGPVSPGEHQVKVQMAIGGAGYVLLGAKTLSVLRSKI